jgi:hypothetical protein
MKTRTEERTNQGKGIQCHEREGYGHIRVECPTYLKNQKKGRNVISWSDEEDYECDNEGTKSVNAISGRCLSDSALMMVSPMINLLQPIKIYASKVGNFARQMKNKIRSSPNSKRKSKYHLPTIYNLQSEANMLNSKHESMDIQLRFLNNGTDRLDVILKAN